MVDFSIIKDLLKMHPAKMNLKTKMERANVCIFFADSSFKFHLDLDLH